MSSLPTTISQESPHPADVVAATLADAMAAAWRGGNRTKAETLLEQHPEVTKRPEAAVRVIYEEVLLRRDLGEEPDEAEIIERFPRWRDELMILLACDRLVRPDAGDPDATSAWPGLEPVDGAWPEVGERLGGFRLLARLGSGSMGYTYLASEGGLADRPVVLKLTPRGLNEHVSLARLQHTNIVPLHAAPEFPGRNLRALCMPYLGGASLDRVLADLRSRHERVDGRAVVEAIDRVSEGLPVAVESTGPARRLLATFAYPEAVAWIAACLADALHAAHGRGLVHMDVKPANVLLAADGTPMLLDFHLARPPVVAGGPSPGSIGGTPSTMAPEQRAAMEALSSARPVRQAIDGRADIYALGRTIDASLDVRGGRESVSPGLRAIIDRCLEPHPADRYPDAAALGDDLRRHLNDLPLRGARVRSLRERWAKWRRRSPQALPRLALMALALGVVAALLVQGQVRQDRARGDLIEARDALARGRFDDAHRLAESGLDRLGRWNSDRALRGSLADVRSRSGLARARNDLHVLADTVRFAARGDDSPSGLARLRAIKPRLHDAWTAARALGFFGRDRDAAPSAIDPQVASDLGDLALLAADLAVKLADPAARPGARREALAILDEAEAALGPGRALAEARRSHAEALGLKDAAAAAERQAESLHPASASDFDSVGLARLQAGDRAGAVDAFGRALDLDPHGFWPLFHRGIAAYGLGRFEDARADFHACVALASGSAEALYNRALALDALNHPDDALRDLDRALALNPRLAEAALNAGLIRYRLGRHDEAEASFHRALELGTDPARAHYNLALVRLALGDRAGAIAHLKEAHGMEPARRLLDQLGPGGR